MSCGELFRRAVEALERDVYDWEAMDELVYGCGEPFAGRIIDAVVRRVAQHSMSMAWRHYRGAVLAGRHPAVAYAEAVYMVGRPWDGAPAVCRLLASLSAYLAEAAAKYSWPARWPFLAMPSAAAKEEGCKVPDAVAEHLGPDEWAELESFLEDGAGVVEVAGRKITFVRDGRYIGIVI
jgi:hypothetical protein